jgi:hypothetical protein
MPAVGVLVSKATPTTGLMQRRGEYNLISGLDFTRPALYVGAAGVIHSPPTAGPLGYAMVQSIGKAIADDIIWLTGNTQMTMRR